ncbi:hypothetical protein [Streptomyces fructofermentans]|uniref:Uncharacterized protein n=1 Tax=Streptomyces fructofermentans TaxID=152141 RepID=A0A918KUQ3_9ACTN|nr:hypothetical protein [Streptomyces fructofermentans]GGX76522.1 hypothetical protein GCM10010515_50450 [Streptomyces fructofermentans]
MASFHIRVDDADEETGRRALEALAAAGIGVDRAWLDDGPADAVPPPDSPGSGPGRTEEPPAPHGWPMWVSLALLTACFALVVLWIWSGDWRFAVTAGVAGVFAAGFFVGSF